MLFRNANEVAVSRRLWVEVEANVPDKAADRTQKLISEIL